MEELNEANEYIASEHAYKMAKERLRWNKKTLDKMIIRAFEDGIKHSDTNGQLKTK